MVSLGTTPHPVTVTTSTIPFLVGNPYKHSFVTVTGWGVDQRYHFFPVIPRFDGSKAAKTQHIRSHITSSTWQMMKLVRTEVCWEMSPFLGLIHPYNTGALVSCCISGNGKLPSFRGTGFLAIIGLSGVMHCHPKLKIFRFKVHGFGWQYRDLR